MFQLWNLSTNNTNITNSLERYVSELFSFRIQTPSCSRQGLIDQHKNMDGRYACDQD